MTLLRTDPLHSSLLSLQSLDAMVELPKNKKRPIDVLCASAKFQLFCGAVLIAIVGSVVAVGITLAKGPEPWVSPTSQSSTIHGTQHVIPHHVAYVVGMEPEFRN
jgi:hypothetical protein